MKILLVGGQKKWAIENYYKQYISTQGVEVDIFPIHDLYFQKISKNILFKILNRLDSKFLFNSVNQQLKVRIDNFQPDIVWIFKGMEVHVETLQWIKSNNIKLVNYNPDNPFIFTGIGSGNKNVTNAIGLYDLHFTYSHEIQKEIEEKYRTKTAYLPFGFDISPILFERSQQKGEIIKVCFLGNPDKQRAKFLIQLADAGIKIDLFGNNWNKFVSHSNFTIYEPVFEEKFWEILYRYRVQLNIMRIHNENSHNMRTFEIPGIGGIQLAPRTKEHELFFLEGKEIFLYDGVVDCVKNIKKILSMKTGEAFIVRQQVRKRCIECHYSYQDRSILALNTLKQL
jgi:spore maturation protein CgeB